MGYPDDTLPSSRDLLPGLAAWQAAQQQSTGSGQGAGMATSSSTVAAGANTKPGGGAAGSSAAGGGAGGQRSGKAGSPISLNRAGSTSQPSQGLKGSGSLEELLAEGEEAPPPPVALGRIRWHHTNLAVMIVGEAVPRWIESVAGSIQFGPGYR